MAPICSRTRALTSLKRAGDGVAGRSEELGEVVGWMNANGICPFRGSGMPTTQASPMEGWERTACSMAPVSFNQHEEWVMLEIMSLTSTESMGSYVNDIIGSGHDVDIAIFVDHTCITGIDPFAFKSFEISLVEALFVIEEGCEGGWS